MGIPAPLSFVCPGEAEVWPSCSSVTHSLCRHVGAWVITPYQIEPGKLDMRSIHITSYPVSSGSSGALCLGRVLGVGSHCWMVGVLSLSVSDPPHILFWKVEE